MNKNRTCYIGDCREAMRSLAKQGQRVQMCITSPPYWGLRDYGHGDQLGLEPTIGEYITNMVEVFRCVWDILADDGTLWVNMGDSYTNNRVPGGGDPTIKKRNIGKSKYAPTIVDGLKPKNLIGMPWRLAFALQADGWYLRQDIIWHKPNPMPESVTDRCTKSHEYIFLLSKNPKYYFNQEAILEPCSQGTHARLSQDVQNQIGSKRANGNTRSDRPMKAVGRKLEEPGKGTKNNASFDDAMAIMPLKRNKRSVWKVATESFKGAHFATYPQKLITPCILAGSRPEDTVLDPFFGSGTTGQVCESLGRQWVGCELNEHYAKLRTLVDIEYVCLQ